MEVRVAGDRLQSGALESRADVIRGGAILVGVGEPAAHRVAGEEEEVGAQVGLRDRLVAGRPLLRRQRRGEKNGSNDRERRVICFDLASL